MNNWTEIIGDIKRESYFYQIMEKVNKEYSEFEILPPKNEIFEAFRVTDFAQLKVVILGQDPYHGQGQAHGLAFSVLPEIPIPPSLKNIYKELADDIPNFIIPKHGYLENWANQGVFLLNNVLTVRSGQPQSHHFIGWQLFTDEIIRRINSHKEHVVFMLWGASAQTKEKMIDGSRHLILKAPHPSPLSAHRGFFGCHHFSKANEFLLAQGQKSINWQL